MNVSDLAAIANADVWFEVYDGEGKLIADGDYEAISNIDNVIIDFWINKDSSLCMHVESK